MSAPPGAFFSSGRSGGTAGRSQSPNAQRGFSPNNARQKSPESRLHVVDPPPFLTGSQRFNKNDLGGGTDSPSYHVAYRDVMQPTKRETKGWSGLDDSIKHGRGTSTGKVHSSMATPSGPPTPGATLQPLNATHPNETRLQELLHLQRRKFGQSPGPGAYDMPGFKATRSTFRRTNVPQLDGPFLPHQGVQTVTTRSKEIDQMLKRQPDSGRSPGDYESHITKDALSRTAPASSIGTGSRAGRTEHAKSLSLSRSIQHGIDWHVPVIIKIKNVAEDGMEGANDVPGDKRRGRRNMGQVVSEPARKPSRPAAAATSSSAPGQDQLDNMSPLRERDLVARPPMPPSAVARSVRKPQAGVPGEWDWNKLGHNYRSNWTTLHGGAYSLGDRSTCRRDKQGLRSEQEGPPDASPPQDGAPGEAVADDAGADGFRSIDPMMMPFSEVGDTMFPIPEEQGDVFADIGYSPSHSHAPGSPFRQTDHHSSAASGTPYLAGLSKPSCGFFSGVKSAPASNQAGMSARINATSGAALSRAEITRHESAAAAAAFVEAANTRRSEWLAKSDIMAA